MELPKLHDWIDFNGYDWEINNVTWPEHLNISLLSKEDKDIITLYILNHNIPNKESLLEYLDK